MLRAGTCLSLHVCDPRTLPTPRQHFQARSSGAGGVHGAEHKDRASTLHTVDTDETPTKQHLTEVRQLGYSAEFHSDYNCLVCGALSDW